MNTQTNAVLTGDVVNSGRLPDETLAALQQRLKSLPAEFDRTFPGTVAGKLGITRGDGWQVALKHPQHAVRMALFLRAAIRAEFDADSCISIGIGPVSRVVAARISESTGVAFDRSGRGLEALGKKKRLCLAGQGDKALGKEIAEQHICDLLDCLARRWSRRQAFVARFSLLGMTQADIAQRSPSLPGSARKPSRQAISKSQNQMDFPVIEEVLNYFETQPS